MVAFGLQHVHERRHRGRQPRRRDAAVVQQQNRTGPQSAPSNDAQAIIPGAFPPTGLTVTAN